MQLFGGIIDQGLDSHVHMYMQAICACMHLQYEYSCTCTPRTHVHMCILSAARLTASPHPLQVHDVQDRAEVYIRGTEEAFQ